MIIYTFGNLYYGCFNYKELNNYAIVTALSIDVSDKGYEVSALITNATKENENVKKERANQGKIIMNNTGGNIIYSKQKEQNEDKKI